MSGLKEITPEVMVRKNPHASIFNISFGEKDAVCARLKIKNAPENLSVAVLPTSLAENYGEVAVSTLLLNIINAINGTIPLSLLADRLMPCFGGQISEADARKCILGVITSAVERGVLFVIRNG